MSREGKKKGRSGHDKGPTIQIDVARWEAARRRWLLRHIGGGVLVPAFLGYVFYHDFSLKEPHAGSIALFISGLLMLVFSLAARWHWRDTRSVAAAPPARVAIKDAPEGERVLVSGSVVPLDRTVAGPASGRQGVYCRVDVEVEFRSNNGSIWGPHHTREWSAPFLIEDGSGGSLRLDGKSVHINSELSRLTLTYESKTGVSGLPDQIQRYIRENKISFKESQQRIRVVESVLGKGDVFTLIGHLTAPSTQAPSLYRAVEPKPRELLGAELMMPLSLDDLRRLAADNEQRTRLVNAGVIAGIGLFIAGVLMRRG